MERSDLVPGMDEWNTWASYLSTGAGLTVMQPTLNRIQPWSLTGDHHLFRLKDCSTSIGRLSNQAQDVNTARDVCGNKGCGIRTGIKQLVGKDHDLAPQQIEYRQVHMTPLGNIIFDSARRIKGIRIVLYREHRRPSDLR